MSNQVRKKILKEVEAFLDNWSLVIDSRLRFDLIELEKGKSKYAFEYFINDISLNDDSELKLNEQVINDYIHEVKKTYDIELKLNESRGLLEVR